MISLGLIIVVIALAVGIAAKYILEATEIGGEITWTEFAIGSFIICLIIVPISLKVGWNVAKNNVATFNEYWNGWETFAMREDIECERDGSCVHDYDCDPYIVSVCQNVCSGSGSNQTCHQECHPETRYHSCPYSSVETNYTINTTLGSYDIANHRFPEDPQSKRWRSDEPIPEGVVSSAGTGEPPFWVEAKKRIDSGHPGPVTKSADYKNYILASDNTILKKYSEEVSFFSKKGLFPAFRVGVYSFYLANKVYFVGRSVKDQGKWQNSLAYLNAATGSKLQGDLHVVIVNNPVIEENPDKYVHALHAYWQDRIRLGRDCLSKNTIVVVLGTKDGENISWARSFTGMPVGNEEMVASIERSLKGEKLTPEVVFGDVVSATPHTIGRISKKSTDRKLGLLERIIFGIDNSKLRFARISMSGANKDDNGSGFLYLYKEIVVSTGAKWAIGIVAFFFCSIVWVVFAYVDIGSSNRTRQNSKQRRWKNGL